MPILLSPEVEREIEALVSRGVYASAEQFFEDSLRQAAALERRRAELEAMIDEGVQDLRAGRYVELDRAGLYALGEQIKREGRIAMGLANDTP